MIDDHQFLQAKHPAMVHLEHQAVLQKWHNVYHKIKGMSLDGAGMVFL